MGSDDIERLSAPDWVVRRLNRLATHDPLAFVRRRIPALDHRTVEEVLESPGGRAVIERVLDDLDSTVGLKRDEADFQLIPGIDPAATESHTEFERLNVSWVRHENGWSVGLIPPKVAYRIDDRMACVDAEFDAAPSIAIVPTSLAWVAPRGAPVDEGERDEILARLRGGIRALGGHPEDQPTA